MLYKHKPQLLANAPMRTECDTSLNVLRTQVALQRFHDLFHLTQFSLPMGIIDTQLVARSVMSAGPITLFLEQTSR